MWRLECSLRCAGRAPRGKRIYRRFSAVVEDVVVYKIYECEKCGKVPTEPIVRQDGI